MMADLVALKRPLHFPSFKLPVKGANAAEKAADTLLPVLKQWIN